MLRKFRIAIAAAAFIGTSSLFMTLTQRPPFLSFFAKIQFVPALLSLSFGIAAAWIILTILCGRVYCSAVCPLGIMQDIISHIGARFRKFPKFRYSPASSKTRYAFLAVYVISLVLGWGAVFTLLSPYAVFGRFMSFVFNPAAVFVNNLLVKIPLETIDWDVVTWQYASVGLVSLIVTLIISAAIMIAAWNCGRLYCNTVCPVGTLLGLLGRSALGVIAIDSGKCIKCGMCSAGCKASCIDVKAGLVDNSRCVKCFNCAELCRHGAIGLVNRYAGGAAGAEAVPGAASAGAEAVPGTAPAGAGTVSGAGVASGTASAGAAPSSGAGKNDAHSEPASEAGKDLDDSVSRRNMLGAVGTAALLLGAGSVLLPSEAGAAENGTPDSGKGGQKSQGGPGGGHGHGGHHGPKPARQNPERRNYIIPFGSGNILSFHRRCIGCLLCVSSCPSRVLNTKASRLLINPQAGILNLTQPAMSFEHGYCRPECTKCSHVCPTGAIMPVTSERKTAGQIGIAEWNSSACRLTAGRKCTACSKICPNGAIAVIDSKDDPAKKQIAVNTERCMGCGAASTSAPPVPYRLCA